MAIQNDYNATVQYLYEQLPMFSKLGKDAIKKDLTNISRLCEALGHPEKKFQCIHIAGTNGKGSTSHMLAAILQHAGHKTGLYTSPHLLDFRERFRVNGALISQEWVVDFVHQHRTLIESIQPSFFEITVAMAFQAFAEQGVTIAIIETGLGGRLDSTNVITPILSIITNVSYDHQDLLGQTLPEIAREKAGIIKPQVPVLIGEENDATNRVFFEVATHNNSRIYYAQSVWDLVRVKQDNHYQFFKAIHQAQRAIYDVTTDLLGVYQLQNIRTVLAAVEILDTTSLLPLSLPSAIDALRNVKELTGLKGRWEVLQQQPLIVADVAHNMAGVKEVMQQWQSVSATKKHVVVGFVKDKDVSAALSQFPQTDTYYFCHAAIPRALPAKALQEIASGFSLQGQSYASVSDAMAAAKNAMGAADALLITGSFFIVSEALTCWNQEVETN